MSDLAPMDGRRRRWLAVDVEFSANPLGKRLRYEFGNEGLAVWVAMLAAAKRSPNEGQVSYSGDPDLWNLLAIEPPAFTADEFLRVTGAMKETRRTRRGDVTDVTLTRFGDLQQTIFRQHAAERQSRSRARNTSDIGVTDKTRQDSDSDISLLRNGPTEKQLAYLADLGHQGPRPETASEASQLITKLRKPTDTEGRTDPSPDRNDPATCPHLAVDIDGWCSACSTQVGASQ